MSASKITDATFDQEVLKSDKPVLVDFWAEWCGPCKFQGPIVDELAKEYDGKAKVVSVEVDENPQMAQQYGILSIPTVMIFKNGRPVWQGVGLHQKDRLSEQLDRSLK